MTLPVAPTALSATPGDNSASIAFTQTIASPSITNYKYSINGATGFTALSPADATTPITIPNLANGVQVGIRILAVNSDGDGAISASVNVTPADPTTADNNGFSDPTGFANIGEPVPHLDFNDPDD